jgi:hypothetical protein
VFIHNADDQPAHRTAVVANRPPGRQTVRRKDDLLVHSRAVRIYCDLWRAFGIATGSNGLANHKPPSMKTRMFPGRHHAAFNASQ